MGCKNCGIDCAGSFCSVKCRSSYTYKKSLASGKVKLKGFSDEVLNRPYTCDTAWLCRKWYEEGMTIKEIAEILHRSEKNVTEAILIAKGLINAG